MIRKLFIIFVISQSLISCSTLRKSVFYSGLTGMGLGIAGGAGLSPNKGSVAPNMAVWGSLGALVGAGLGYFFYMDDPENKDLPNMILDKNKFQNDVSRIELTPIVPKDSKYYKLENGPLPENLKDRVKPPVLIEHEIPERVERLENGKTITVEKHKAWEMTYE